MGAAEQVEAGGGGGSGHRNNPSRPLLITRSMEVLLGPCSKGVEGP